MDRHVFYCHAPHNADLTFSIGPEINDITYIARSASYMEIISLVLNRILLSISMAMYEADLAI
jgi:hypothetical protein